MAETFLEQARKAKRVNVSLRSRIRHSGSEEVEVEIKDLSFYGFRAEGTVPIPVGSYVSVDLPRLGLVRARIAWIRGDTFGGLFATAVDVRKCVLPSRGP